MSLLSSERDVYRKAVLSIVPSGVPIFKSLKEVYKGMVIDSKLLDTTHYVGAQSAISAFRDGFVFKLLDS